MAGAPRISVGRNTALLSGSQAMSSATVQLAAAVASLTLVGVLNADGLLGLGPAIVLGSGALVALPAGLLMDRFGRVPGLAVGFAAGIAGCSQAALGSARGSAAAVLGGLMLVGGASATALLARTAAADIARSPRPRHRARPLRLGVRGDPRAGRLQPPGRGSRARRRCVEHAVARGGRVHDRRPRARLLRAPGPEADRRAARA